MTRKTCISVRTGTGMTAVADVGEVIGQGTIGGTYMNMNARTGPACANRSGVLNSQVSQFQPQVSDIK